MAARFDSIELVVTDMEASLGFYRRLGLSIPGGRRLRGSRSRGAARWREDPVRHRGDHAELLRLDATAKSGGHRIALAFACDSPTDVDTVYAQFIESGAPSHLEPMDAFWGQRYATVLDPDGNSVDLFAPLEDTVPQG